ncbi:glycosidase [Candidatus Bathyarchaeota archaeon]|nr:glycosidase [Candidatus Bathyarchaeota archaeon]
MARFEGNPILKPIKDHPWESKYVFNTAMISLGGRIHYFYRAMGEDNVSRLGYASSEDGCHIDVRHPYPVFEPSCPLEKYGCEDPRMTLIGDMYVMTYTAYGDIFQVGITSISSEDILEMNWAWGERRFPFPNTWNKNAVIFPRMIDGRYVMLHRHEPDICIAHSDDLCNWNHSGVVMRPRPGRWDCSKIGSAGPPIELEDGWLLVYHGVDEDRTYRLGVTILDKNDPGRVLGRADKPILEPWEEYERVGQVPNVVFSCGSVLLGGNLLISYGAADTVIGVASFGLGEILDLFV